MEIKDFIGIPYISNGRDLQGLDCWGLVYQFLLFQGKQIPELTNLYDNAESSEQVEKVVIDKKPEFKRVLYEQRELGDIILFKIKNAPVHVGVILDHRKMLHTLAGHNSCVEDYTSMVWDKRIEGIYRWET